MSSTTMSVSNYGDDDDSVEEEGADCSPLKARSQLHVYEKSSFRQSALQTDYQRSSNLRLACERKNLAEKSSSVNEF